MRRDKRGQIRIMEAFLSALLIFSALAISAALSPTAASGNGKNLAAQGMQTLVQLDSDGRLGEMIEVNNWTALSSAMQLLLPAGVTYNLTVYNLTVYNQNAQPIMSSPLTSGVLIGNVISIEYLCAAQGPQFKVYLLRLQLAVVR